ncbi:MAG: matrixin family metalloprotease [Armatimonadota bacterium]
METMPKRVVSGPRGCWLVLVLFLSMLLAGCGGGGESTTFAAPPQPVAGATPLDPFYVVTSNYFTTQTGEISPNSQFADAHYPIPFSYVREVPDAPEFLLPEQNELAIQAWAQADLRVTIISGVPVGQERVKVLLTGPIEYDGQPGIIGLTRLISGGTNPRFEVYVTTRDPYTNEVRVTSDMAKTLSHELGHVFGLGHSPDQRDLMYYRDNGLQGATTWTFLTYGDAITIWTTLNNRRINWVETRPTISYPATPQVRTTRRDGPVRIPNDGTVIDVYTP